jgi:hypothetical protein
MTLASCVTKIEHVTVDQGSHCRLCQLQLLNMVSSYSSLKVLKREHRTNRTTDNPSFELDDFRNSVDHVLLCLFRVLEANFPTSRVSAAVVEPTSQYSKQLVFFFRSWHKGDNG